MLITRPISLFFKYVIPSILGLLAISSASIIDGYFIGNYIGSQALAAVNISYPLTSILFGLALMFAVGSSVTAGKLMGEKQHTQASEIFSKTIITIALVSVILCLILYLCLNWLLHLINVQGELQELTLNYLPILLMFLPSLMVAIVLDYFVRVDENPNLSFLALFLSALLNIVLDYYFIVQLQWGLQGAALATGLSQVIIIFILIPHFFRQKSTLKFLLPKGSWDIIFKALKNGSSEFVNESSAGITIIIFNYIMLKHFGTSGVASYTIIGYFIMLSIMISFAVSDALQPIISKNYGALEFHRIKSFLRLGFGFIVLIESLIALAILMAPEVFVGLFLKQEEVQTQALSVEFISYAWPALILSGVNILITSYLTSMQKPKYSATIALLRSLAFPIILINTLPYFFGHIGIFMALSVSEFLTLLVALYFFNQTRPSSFIPH